MPDPSTTRRIRLTPVPRGTPAQDAVPVARDVLERAMQRVGPGGLGDMETRLSEAAGRRDLFARGGSSEGNSAIARPVRLCTTLCEFRANGGGGCEFFKAAEAETPSRSIAGEQCERDLALIDKVETVFQTGDTEQIRAIAGRFTGATFIEIQKLFERIIADGAVVYHPVISPTGEPVYEEVIALDGHGNVVRDSRGEAIKRKVPITIPKEHPVYGKLIQLLRETRVVDLSQWNLTPRSSGSVPKTDGMILLEETTADGGRSTMAAIHGDIQKGLKMLANTRAAARKRREEDPAYVAMRDSIPTRAAEASATADTE